MAYIVAVATIGYFHTFFKNLKEENYLGSLKGWSLVYSSLFYGFSSLVLTVVFLNLVKLLLPQPIEMTASGFLLSIFRKPDYVYLALSFLTAVVWGRASAANWYLLAEDFLKNLICYGFDDAWERTSELWKGSDESPLVVLPDNNLTITLYEIIGSLVLLELSNRKVYIAFLQTAELRESVPFEERTLQIDPIKSGFRSSETMEVSYTTNYPQNDGDPLALTIFLKDVATIRPFSENLDSFFHGEKGTQGKRLV